MCKDGKAWGHRHTDHLPTAGRLEGGIIFGWLGDLGGDMVDKLARHKTSLEAQQVLKSRALLLFESF